jgi:hypothetical protein
LRTAIIFLGSTRAQIEDEPKKRSPSIQPLIFYLSRYAGTVIAALKEYHKIDILRDLCVQIDFEELLEEDES